MSNKIKVLIVDDSAVIRQSLEQVLSSDPKIQVIATAPDPYVAAERIAKEVPDVITLDVEMPRMDGITFLQKIMSQHPIPIVICSSLSDKGSETALKAMEYGAVDVIFKPKIGAKQYLEESRIQFIDAVKAAASAKIDQVKKITKIHQPKAVAPKLTADAVLSKPSRAMVQTTEKIVVVGASTGGTEALRIFLETLPADSPGIIIVQHMPEVFTSAFAKRLDGLCQVSVKEAENNDSVIRGRVLIAPGNRHLIMKRSGARYFVEIKDGPLVSRHRPSVDVLFRSAAQYCGKNAVGVIMTGMGDDGARGMEEMKQAGAVNIAQDEASCVVFGMPNEAIKRNCIDHIVPLQKISQKVLQLTA